MSRPMGHSSIELTADIGFGANYVSDPHSKEVGGGEGGIRTPDTGFASITA